MTRDEHRKACIEAMDDAFYKITGPRVSRKAMTAAFDSLHGLAMVNPVEATEEMIEAAHRVGYRARDIFKLTFAAMSAKGDLTNPPESKP